MRLLELSMLVTNRIGHVRRVMEQLRSLRSIISKASATKTDTNPALQRKMLGLLKQKTQEVVATLVSPRWYVETKQGGKYSPSYLVFEYARNLVLRPRQYELVESFKQCLKEQDTATKANDPTRGITGNVKQMIMGVCAFLSMCLPLRCSLPGFFNLISVYPD